MLSFHDCIRDIQFDFRGTIIDVKFDKDDLFKWINENYNISDVFDEGEIIEFVSNNYEPEDVFNDIELEDWCNNNE